MSVEEAGEDRAAAEVERGAAEEGAGDDPDDDDALCVVCLANEKTHALVPCGHQCLCGDCAATLMGHTARPECPVCRGEALSSMRIYR